MASDQSILLNEARPALQIKCETYGYLCILKCARSVRVGGL